MPKRILLIGNGAREHAIGEVIRKSTTNPLLFTYGKARNPGLISLSEGYEVGALNDLENIKNYALKIKPDFAFIGPEDPMADGVTDILEANNIKTVAPNKMLARLESSKSFTRLLINKYGIEANPKFKTYRTDEGLEKFIREDLSGEFVVKADVLMGGKGVKVFGDHFSTVEEGLAYALECLEKHGKVVIEEKLIGQEFSLMSFTDGHTVLDMPAVQDHKRAFEGDRGPNTGGMGSYSDADFSLPFLQPADLENAHRISEQTVAALKKELKDDYHGVIYGGFIAVKDGIKLIEYNARFGDPEAMNVLSILKTDFVEICEAILHRELHKIKLTFEPKATVCKYIVPAGYPDKPQANQKITTGQLPKEAKIFYAAVDQKEDGLYLTSSRAVGIVGVADTLPQAEQIAEQAVNQIQGPVFHRKDIGTKTLINQRIAMLKKIRTPFSN